jgi:tetratricopeptide (TPR) repeat protein
MSRRLSRRAALLTALLVLFVLAVVSLVFVTSSSRPTAASTAVPLPDAIVANLALDRPLQALYHVEAQAVQFGWTADRYRIAASLWMDMGDPSRALPYWQAAAQLAPGDASLQSRLAHRYLDTQQWALAADSLRELVKAAPGENWAHFYLGLLTAPSNPVDALDHLRLASRDPVYDEPALALLEILNAETSESARAMAVGVALAERDFWPYAELAFNYAAVIGEPFPEALAYAGLARDEQGKDGSLQIEQALALAPDNPSVYYLQGLHLRSRGELVSSIAAFQNAITLDPTNPAYAAEIGSAYRLYGDNTQAEFWLQEAVRLSNGDARFQRLLDQFYAELPLIP